MSGERLSAHSVSDVPQFGGRVTGARHEGPGVWAEGQAHHVSAVPCERGSLLTGLNVPQRTAEEDSWVTLSTELDNSFAEYSYITFALLVLIILLKSWIKVDKQSS